ncbi:MAG: hypothetical protein JSR82_15900 [Verrucomicrobia bacterium]|nr:hypothetical protein [Verrucomicrobiota bacterium]
MAAVHPAAGLRLLVLNNYPLAQVWEEVRRGEKPDHHLFGLNHLQDLGVQISLAPTAAATPWRRVDRALAALRLPLPLGPLGPQLAARRGPEPVDAIFSASDTEANLLALLPRSRRPPLLVLRHHPTTRGRLAGLRRGVIGRMLRQTEATLTLSRAVAEQLQTLSLTSRPVQALAWGPDAGFYPPATGPGHGCVAIGRTGRDFATFGLGATRAGTPARIVCPAGEVDPEFAQFGPNVGVEILPDDRLRPYPELFESYRSARVVALPLDPDEHAIAGLTGLLDALGLGRAVLMTRNRWLDLDLEALRIGAWVEPGDIDGWARALRWFEEHPDEAEAMGRRARALVDAGFDSRHFAHQLADVLAEVCRPSLPT